MAYRFFIAGIEVQCDSLEDLLAAVKSGVADNVSQAPSASPPIEPEPESNKTTQGSGPKRAWVEAREYAEKHGITAMEARGILSKQRKDAVEKALQTVKKN